MAVATAALHDVVQTRAQSSAKVILVLWGREGVVVGMVRSCVERITSELAKAAQGALLCAESDKPQ